ncbi:MAG: HDIG domain-containing protein [Armatimonadetes bacterium]|nr:HDIG domain-containing protein [Armatimonadota bacterium]
MPDFSFDSLAQLLSGGRAKLGEITTRGATRIVGAIVMAALLLLNTQWPFDWLVGSGMAVLSIIAGLMLRAHLKTVTKAAYERRKFERLIWFTALLSVLGVQLANLSLTSGEMSRVSFLFLAPLVAQAMLVSALISPSIGLVALSMTVLLVGTAGILPLEIAMAGWLSGAVACHVVNPLKQRSDLLRAAGLQTLAQAVIGAILILVIGTQITSPWEAAAWSAVAAIIATSIFWLGVAVLEKLFGIVSDWSLLELSSPDHPLIRELVLRAPGTYAHSVGVANLAEEAARAVGANPLLVRTMAYFHDIGKTERPNFFIENQSGDNVHDELSPNLSAQVISAHVTDGVKMAKKHRLPQVIVDGIEQHHGTSLITYFYHRAMAQMDETAPEILQEKFRYPGPKPQSRETAILHLADMVEAASRTLKKGDDVEEFVSELIEKSRADGQLDESDLTFKDLQIIGNAFVKSLKALRHDRIEYPAQAAISPLEEPPFEIPNHDPESTV